jgi:hypothetical protein
MHERKETKVTHYLDLKVQKLIDHHWNSFQNFIGDVSRIDCLDTFRLDEEFEALQDLRGLRKFLKKKGVWTNFCKWLEQNYSLDDPDTEG